jgi:Flp pilus assembly protein TadD
VEHFKKAISLDPDFYSAYMDLQMMYERLGEKDLWADLLQRSLQMYPRYLSRHPEDARAHMLFATDFGKAGRFEEAKREAAKALELNPSDALMLYNAACFYARIGEKPLAIKSLKDSFTAGYQNYEWAKRDTDFDSIRNEPGYIELVKGK